MRMRNLGLFLGVVVAALLNDGCKKSETEAAKTAQSSVPTVARPTGSPGELILQLHWVGKKRLQSDTNATELLKIWNLPESQKLELQTLGKLALLPWQTNGNHSLSNHPMAELIRPLLQDLVQEETFLEIRQATNQANTLGLAVRLSDERSRAWDTGLKTALTSLAGNPAKYRAAGEGWEVQLTNHSSAGSASIEFARSGGWTIIAAGNAHSEVVAELMAGMPARAAAAGTNIPWLQLQAEVMKLCQGSKAQALLGTNPPHLGFSVIGDGRNVRTHADLVFDAPLNLKLEPWQLPTNLVHDPLIGFSAIRGFQPILEAWAPWKFLSLGTPPNQAYFWAQSGFPSRHFMASPAKDAAEKVAKLSDTVLTQINPILQANQPKFGEFLIATNHNGLVWKGIPWFSPTLRYIDSTGVPFVFAGFSPLRATNKPAPPELWLQIYSQTNLVYYDWELTGACDEGLTQLAQLSRNVLGLGKLTYSASLAWLKVLQPLLGPSATGVSRISPAHFSFHRTSGIGLTAVELELLADWLESPTFPKGVRTFVAPRIAPPVPASGTNNVNTAPPGEPQIINIPAAADPTNPPPK
jgi:hypothetical protein